MPSAGQTYVDHLCSLQWVFGEAHLKIQFREALWEVLGYFCTTNTTGNFLSRLRTMACYRSIHEVDVIFYHSYCLRFQAQSSHAMSSGFWHAQVWLSWRERNRVTEQFSRTEGKVKATTGINLTVQVFSTPLKSIARLRQSASSLVGVRERYPLINCINSIPFRTITLKHLHCGPNPPRHAFVLLSMSHSQGTSHWKLLKKARPMASPNLSAARPLAPQLGPQPHIHNQLPLGKEERERQRRRGTS